MTDVFNTVISGTSVFVLGQLISKFIIDPVHEQQKVFGEIVDALIFYKNIFGRTIIGTTKEGDEAQNKLRSLATKLLSKTHLIPFYGILEFLFIVKPLKNILDAHGGLIGLSNSVYVNPYFLDNVDDYYNQIHKALNIKEDD